MSTNSLWPAQTDSSAWAVTKKQPSLDPAVNACDQADQALLQGQIAAAEAMFRQAVKDYPQSAFANGALANFLYSHDRPYAALDQVNQVLVRMPPDTVLASAWLVCAKVFHRTGHLAKCLTCYDAYLKLAPASDEKAQYEALAEVIRGQVNSSKKRPAANVVTVSGADNYFKEAVSDGFFRWPSKRLPLRVLIRPGDNLKSYKPEYEEALRQAVDSWNTASDNRPGMFFVDSGDADIVVDFVDDLHAPALRAEAGKTQLTGNMDGVDKASVLLLTVSPFPGQTMNRDFMRMIAVHEIGHALGLVGHSPYDDDVMFPSLSAQRGITTRDVTTLQRLYDFGSASDSVSGGTSGGGLTSESFDSLPLKGKVQLLFAEAARARANKDSSRAIELFAQILKLDPLNRNGHSFMANELNNIGLAKRESAVEAVKYFRWASYFDSSEEIYQKNMFASLFNMQLEPSSLTVRIKEAEQCLAANDFRGAVVEYRAALKLKNDPFISAKLPAIEKKAIDQNFQ